jgi:hypothetical protein
MNSKSTRVRKAAVRDDALAAGVGGELGDEGPAALFGGFVEEVLEGSLEAEFVGDRVGFKVLKVLEIGLDDRVTGGQFDHTDCKLLSVLSVSIGSHRANSFLNLPKEPEKAHKLFSGKG